MKGNGRAAMRINIESVNFRCSFGIYAALALEKDSS